MGEECLQCLLIGALHGTDGTAYNTGVNLLSFLFSADIGVVFGYFPARCAVRLDLSEALKPEQVFTDNQVRDDDRRSAAWLAREKLMSETGPHPSQSPDISSPVCCHGQTSRARRKSACWRLFELTLSAIRDGVQNSA